MVVSRRIVPIARGTIPRRRHNDNVPFPGVVYYVLSNLAVEQAAPAQTDHVSAVLHRIVNALIAPRNKTAAVPRPIASPHRHDCSIPVDCGHADAVIGHRRGNTGNMGAVPIEIVGIVVFTLAIFTSGRLVSRIPIKGYIHEIPANQVVKFAIAVSVGVIQVTGIKHPEGIPLQFDGMPVAVGVLPQVLPDMLPQVHVVPIDPGIDDRQNDGRIPRLDRPGAFGHDPGEMDLLVIERIIRGYIYERRVDPLGVLHLRIEIQALHQGVGISFGRYPQRVYSG